MLFSWILRNHLEISSTQNSKLYQEPWCSSSSSRDINTLCVLSASGEVKTSVVQTVFFSISILSLSLSLSLPPARSLGVCGGTADVAKVSAAGAALCQSSVCPWDRIQSDRSRESRYFFLVNCST